MKLRHAYCAEYADDGTASNTMPNDGRGEGDSRMPEHRCRVLFWRKRRVFRNGADIFTSMFSLTGSHAGVPPLHLENLCLREYGDASSAREVSGLSARLSTASRFASRLNRPEMTEMYRPRSHIHAPLRAATTR